jgi:hypothetical protein
MLIYHDPDADTFSKKGGTPLRFGSGNGSNECGLPKCEHIRGHPNEVSGDVD